MQVEQKLNVKIKPLKTTYKNMENKKSTLYDVIQTFLILNYIIAFIYMLTHVF